MRSDVADDIYLTDTELAARVPLSASTLRKKRITGDGPPFIKASRRVLYHWPTVVQWLAAQTVNSTSEYRAR